MSAVKIFCFIFITLMLSSLFSLIGIPINNYEVNKCNYMKENTEQSYYDYEFKEDCYMTLNLTNWNLFWYMLLFFIFGLFIFGLTMFVIYHITEVGYL